MTPSIKSGLPPGPKGTLIGGSIRQFRASLLDFLLNTAREYGPLASFRIGPRRVFLASGPDLIEQVLAGYAGDVWFPQPAPRDHPWRTMPHHGMTPHISGSSLSAQARYAAGTREILESYFAGKPIRTEYLVVDKGKLAGVGAHSYTAGDATKGSEEAAKYGR